MKTFKERISDVSSHLQALMAPSVFPKVQEAVEKKDKKELIEVCRKINIPESYLNTVVSVILSVSPQQKWPAIM
jgi:hypothetical protein